MIGLEPFILDLLKKPWGRVIVGLTMVAAGMGFWLLSYPNLRDMRALKAHGRRVSATVIDFRISTDHHGVRKNYGIRYGFRVVPKGTWYTQSEKGPLARKELWTTLPKEDWDRAAKTFVVDVDYLPSDPSVNCLAGKAGGEVGGVYGLMAFAVVFALPGVVIAANGILRLIGPRAWDAGGSAARRRPSPI